MTHQYIVSVPGRAQPLCIEADSWKGVGENGAMFFKGDGLVASLPKTDLIAHASALPAFPDLSQFKEPDLVLPEPACLASFAEPVRALEPLTAQSFATFHNPAGSAFWPLLSGSALGFIGGVGLALSHAGVW